MPYYLFENTDTGEVHEIWFHMNDEKIYNGENNDQVGKWKRLWTVPNAAISSIVDPYNTKSFVAATTNKKGQTVGEMWERSAELSKVRADKEGIDPVKQKFYEDYQKSTGLKNQYQAREEAGIKAKEIVKKLGFRT